MGRTLVGGKPGGGGEYNARYINFELWATPTLQADGKYYIVSDVPYDPAKDSVVGLKKYNDRLYTCICRYGKYRQSTWYAAANYEWASSIGGRLACVAVEPTSKERDFRAQFNLLIYQETQEA